jgi:maltoporin
VKRVVLAALIVAVSSAARAQDAAGNTDVPEDLAQREARADWDRTHAAAVSESAAATTSTTEAATESTSAAASEHEAHQDQQIDELTRFMNGFHFGSYGRVVAASDLQGQTGRQSGIVAFAPRIDQDDTYAELELRREDSFFGVDTRVVFTVAYGGPLFHYTGDFSSRIAIRNLFVEARNILAHGLSFWGGSRMVRGDDVYLMNFWPLDNLNMVGGGLGYDFEDALEFRLQVGMAEPNNPYQLQTTLAPARVGFIPDTVYILDRPRIVTSGRVTWWPFGRFATTGMLARLYGEQHYLAAGTRLAADGLTTEHLPEDSGYVVGAQVGGYIAEQHAFLNVFFRYARGLGAYDPLGVPFTTGTVIQTGRAEEIRLAVSGNWEWRDNHDIGVGVQLGGWWRIFRDADPAVFNRSAISEGAVSARPMVWFGDVSGVALDLSYQAMQTTAIDERTGQPQGGGIFKLGIMPFLSPFGRGTYTRPQIRLIYVMTARDDGARSLYNDLDPRSHQSIEHFLGIGVEWWFSSSSYGR